MNYSKLIITFLLISIFHTNVFSQQFYLTASGGYSIGMNGQDGVFSDLSYESIDDHIVGGSTFNFSAKNVSFSLGKGADFGIGAGYMFNDYIGVELSVNYLVGKSTESNYESKATGTFPNYVKVVEEYRNESASIKLWRIMPSLVLSTKFEKLNPYAKVGVVFGFGEMTWTEERESKESYSNGTPKVFNWNEKKVYSGGVSVGFHSAVGVGFNLNEKFSLSTEVSYIGLSFTPKKSVITERIEDGNDMLPGMNKFFVETEFEKEISRENFSSINLGEPAKVLQASFPSSSLGFKVGLKFNL